MTLRRTRSTLFGLLALALLLCPLPTTAVRAAGPEDHDIPANASHPRLVPLPDNCTILPSVARPHREVDLGSPMDSIVLELLVQEGDRVKAGDPIARLDDRVARIRLETVRNTAAQLGASRMAQAELEYSRLRLEELTVAREAGASSRDELVRAAIDVRVAEAALLTAQEAIDQAHLNVKLAEAQLEEYTIRAPFAGVVTALRVELGAGVRTGDPLASLQATDLLRADLHLPVEVLEQLRTGSTYDLQVQCGSARLVPATLAFIEPRVQLASGTVRTVFDIPNPHGKLLAGSLVTPCPKAVLTRAAQANASRPGTP